MAAQRQVDLDSGPREAHYAEGERVRRVLGAALANGAHGGQARKFLMELSGCPAFSDSKRTNPVTLRRRRRCHGQARNFSMEILGCRAFSDSKQTNPHATSATTMCWHVLICSSLNLKVFASPSLPEVSSHDQHHSPLGFCGQNESGTFAPVTYFLETTNKVTPRQANVLWRELIGAEELPCKS